MPTETAKRGRPPGQGRLVAVVIASTHPSSVANAAGDAVRALYAQGLGVGAEPDVATIQLGVALRAGGRVTVTATAQKVGA